MKSLEKVESGVNTPKESGILSKKVNKFLIATAFSASLLTGCGGGGGGSSDTSANNTGQTVEQLNAAFKTAVGELELRTLTIDDNANPTDTLSVDVTSISGLAEVTFGNNENILVTGPDGLRIVLTVSSADSYDIGENIESLSFKSTGDIVISKDLVIKKVDETPNLNISNLTCSDTITLGDTITCSAGYNFEDSYTQATAGLYDSFDNLITDLTVTVDTTTKNVTFDQVDTAGLDTGEYTIKLTFEGEGGEQEFEKDLVVVAPNTAPTGENISVDAFFNATASVDLNSYLSDVDGDTVTATIVGSGVDGGDIVISSATIISNVATITVNEGTGIGYIEYTVADNIDFNPTIYKISFEVLDGE